MRILPAVRKLYAFGLLGPAVTLSRLMSEEESGKIESLHALAGLAFEKGDLKQAENFFARAIKLDSGHVTSQIGLYYSILNKRGAKAAQQYLDRYLQQRNAHIYREIDTYVDWLRTSRYVDYPLQVNIETLALCNAKCNFCQYPDILRKGDEMPDDVIRKILGELCATPTDLPFTVTLAGVSEPFLDKRIFDHIAYINETLPHANVAINTNGAPLNERNIERLAKLKIAWMGISVNDYRKAEYEESMKISYDRTIGVLDMLHAKRKSGEIPFNVGVTRAGDGSIHDLHFIDWVQTAYPALTRNYSPQFSWVGEASSALAPMAGCTHWFDITVRSSGQVAFCCIDGHIAFPRGDLKTQNILEVYNAPEYRRLRVTHVTRREIDQCRTCSSG